MRKMHAAVPVVVTAWCVGFLFIVSSQLGAQTPAPPAAPHAPPRGQQTVPAPKPGPNPTQQPGAAPPLPKPPVLVDVPAITFEKAFLANFSDDHDYGKGSGQSWTIAVYRRGDGKPHRLAVDWMVKDIPEAARQQIFAACPSPAGCYSLQINGVDRPVQVMTLGTMSVRTSFDVPPESWPINVQLRMRPPLPQQRGQPADYPYHSAVHHIAATQYDYFEANLYPTFKHPRCTTCHHMGDSAAIWAQHSKNTVVTPSGFPNLKPDDAGSGCNGCHNDIRQAQEKDGGKAQFLGQLGTFTDYEWKSPSFSKNINWEKKVDARDVCTTVLGHLKTQAELHKHFHNDARLAWAVTAADVSFPAGGGTPQPKESAPPGNYAKFLAIVDRWLQIGFPCKP